MVDGRDIAITGTALLASLFLAVTIAGASLPGSSTTDIACNIPVIQEADFCNEVETTDNYKISLKTSIDRDSINRVEYKTENSDGNIFSFTNPELAFPTETRDAKLNYIVRNENGEIVATGTERMGTITGNEEKTNVFSFKEQTGDYTVEISYTGTQCGLLTCNEISKTEETGFTVPNLPLGQYETLEVNFVT